MDLALYAADAFTTEDGQLDLRTRDHSPTGVGAWLQLGQEQVSLEAGESMQVPFAITIPDDAASGDLMGGIVTTSASTAGTAEPERRVAIRVHLRVGDTFEPSLSVESLGVDYSGDPLGTGTATVTYTVRNTGDIMLSAEQSVAVAGPFDAFRVTTDPTDRLPLLLPGETWSVSVPVRDVAPAGILAATVTLTPLYTDPAGSTGPLTAVQSSGSGWALPWLPLLVLILGLGVLAAAVFARKRRRPAPSGRSHLPGAPDRNAASRVARGPARKSVMSAATSCGRSINDRMRGAGDDAEPTGRKRLVERDRVVEAHEVVVADEHQRRMREASEIVGGQRRLGGDHGHELLGHDGIVVGTVG